MRTLILAAAFAAATVLAGPTAADNPSLVGTVGPSFTISLTDAAGNPVTHLDPGTYALVVHDLSDIHNFHLSGPGVNVATDLDFVGDQSFTVTLAGGRYTFVCDAHFASMKGAFTVGLPAAPPPPTTRHAIAARVGPGHALVFPVSLAAGAYKITVSDRSSLDNLHLRGAGVDRKTGIRGTGSVTWNITLKTGVYRVWSDAHPTLRRTVTVR